MYRTSDELFQCGHFWQVPEGGPVFDWSDWTFMVFGSNFLFDSQAPSLTVLNYSAFCKYAEVLSFLKGLMNNIRGQKIYPRIIALSTG
jgi:hypothetical protein